MQIGLNFGDDGFRQSQVTLDGGVALNHQRALLGFARTGQDHLPAGDEKIRDLDIVAMPLTGRGHHQDPPVGVRRDNIAHLADLPGIGQ